MLTGNDSRERVTKRMRWIARIWSLPLIAGALLVAIGWASSLLTGVTDPNAVEEYPLTEALSPIFIVVSVAGLGIAWRWERLGGVIAALFQLAALVALLIHSPLARDFPRMVVPYLLWLIVTVPAALFLVCWWRTRRAASPE
jgi:hypothetical protein